MRNALFDLALIVAGVWLAAAVGTWLGNKIEQRRLNRIAVARLRLAQSNGKAAPPMKATPLP